MQRLTAWRIIRNNQLYIGNLHKLSRQTKARNGSLVFSKILSVQVNKLHISPNLALIYELFPRATKLKSQNSPAFSIKNRCTKSACPWNYRIHFVQYK
jgi:hypothetical protein